MKMSYAEMRLPSASLPVVAWNPRSPTQCCAHACGQPSRCRRSSETSRRTSSRDGRRGRAGGPSSRRRRSCSAARRCRRSSWPRSRSSSSGRPSASSCASVVDAPFGDAGDDQVLLARQADVAAERLDEIGDGDQLVAGREPELHGHADVREAFLLLRVHADVRRRLRRRSAAARSARACGRASPRRARASPRRRCRRP